MTNFRKLVAGACTVGLFAFASGCASTATTQEKDKVSENISQFSKVDVTVTTTLDDAKASMPTVKDAITKEIAGNFTAASSKSNSKSAKTLGLQINIVSYEIHGAFPRLMIGYLLSDKVGIEAKLVDMSTNKTIGTFSGEGTSRVGGIMIGDASTYRASIALGDEISKYLTAHN